MQNDKGLVRRVDELGRVVIPKEIRHSLKIENGNMLEFFCTVDGALKLEKFEPVREFCDFGEKMLYALREYSDCGFMLCDTQKVVAVQNCSKKDNVGKKLNQNFVSLIKQATGKLVCDFPFESFKDEKCVVFPINVLGDFVGCLIVVSNKLENQDAWISAKTISTILSDYLSE